MVGRIVGGLAVAAAESDDWHNAVMRTNEYGIVGVPTNLAARLTPEEQAVLSKINEEVSNLSWSVIGRWSEENKEADETMLALQAKLLGAEIEPEISKDILEKYAGIEEQEEAPGQISMFAESTDYRDTAKQKRSISQTTMGEPERAFKREDN